jgi:hypothetical protein
VATFNRLITFNTAVSDVMGSLGLVPPSDVVTSQDKTAIQMRYLANKVGLELINENSWQVLDKDWTIVTDGVTLTYDLPVDFDHFHQDAAWNRTNRMPAVGSLTNQEWAQITARNLGGTTFAWLYIINNDQLTFFNVGTTPQTIVLPYVSRGWVRTAAGVLTDQLVNSNDVILFDPTLFKAALKLAWQIDKGFDSSAAQKAYDKALSAATGKEVPARTLSLSVEQYPYISANNLPFTGYGTP